MHLFFFEPCFVAWEILVPQPGIEPLPRAVKTQSSNHWNSRELPNYCIFLALGKYSRSISHQFGISSINFVYYYYFSVIIIHPELVLLLHTYP